MPPYTTERVLDVQHWDKRLFSFTTTRSPGSCLHSGQFVMIGLEVDGRKIVRPYNIASAGQDGHLEFYSIKVPGGALSAKFQHIEPQSSLLIGTKPIGTLVLGDLRQGRRLIMFAEGTGVAPFASIVRDPRTYERFEQVILMRSARCDRGLAYGDAVVRRLREDPSLVNAACTRLLDYRSVTRETNRNCGSAFSELGFSPLRAEGDRLMICGSMQMLAGASRMLESKGFEQSPGVGTPGDFLIQRAFVPPPEAHVSLAAPAMLANASVH